MFIYLSARPAMAIFFYSLFSIPWSYKVFFRYRKGTVGNRIIDPIDIRKVGPSGSSAKIVAMSSRALIRNPSKVPKLRTAGETFSTHCKKKKKMEYESNLSVFRRMLL